MMKRLATRAEMLHQAAETATQLMNRAAQLPEDTSKTVYIFLDGWTIRQPQTYADVNREGCLMGNCLAYDAEDYDPHWLWQDMEVDPGEDVDAMHNQLPSNIEIYSLRDPQNIPRATYDPNQLDSNWPNITGRHNSIIKPEYYYRFIDAGFNPDYLFTDSALDEWDETWPRIKTIDRNGIIGYESDWREFRKNLGLS